MYNFPAFKLSTFDVTISSMSVFSQGIINRFIRLYMNMINNTYTHKYSKSMYRHEDFMSISNRFQFSTEKRRKIENILKWNIVI